MMVYDPIVLDEVLDSEQEHEVVRSVLGCKGTSNESVDERSVDVGSFVPGKSAKKQNELLN
jgi:hypothetical protein